MCSQFEDIAYLLFAAFIIFQIVRKSRRFTGQPILYVKISRFHVVQPCQSRVSEVGS